MHNHTANSLARALRGVSTLDFLNRIGLAAVIITVVAIVLCASAYAVDTRLGHSILDRVDPNFRARITTVASTPKQVRTIVPLTNGKILVAGAFNSYNNTATGALVRLNADGSLDSTFDNNAIVLSNIDARIFVAPLANDKIMVGGGFRLASQPNTAQFLVRLNADGTPDATFNYQSSRGMLQDIAVLTNGKILLNGNFFNFPNKIIQINPDGTLDASFNYAITNQVLDIAAQNNRLIIGERNSNGDAISVLRATENGAVDPSFARKTLDAGLLLRLAVQSDNKILAMNDSRVIRLGENGGDDSGFQPYNFEGQPRGIELQANGGITVASGGDSTTAGTKIERLRANGTLDPSFGTYVYPFVLSGFGVQSDGKVLLGDFVNGNSEPLYANGFLRLDQTGAVDASFNTGAGFQNIRPGDVRAVAVQSDNKILIAGDFDTVNDLRYRKIARLNEDATVDTAFQLDTGGDGSGFTGVGFINHIAVQSNGKIVISGSFEYVIGDSFFSNVARLNQDGSIDETFRLYGVLFSGGQFNSSFTLKVAVQNDGDIIVGTQRIGVLAAPVPVRLNPNGSRDTAFNPNLFPGANSVTIGDLLVQPDGKLLATGVYTISIGNTVARKNFVVRLNTDGNLDSTLQAAEEEQKSIVRLALLPDGKILAAKNQSLNLGSFSGELVRLNSDGSLDASFNSSAVSNGLIQAVLRLSTGEILVGGKFTTFAGQPRQNLALLNASGSLSTTTVNVNQEVLNLALDNQGRVLIGGAFTKINAGDNAEAARTYFARMLGDANAASGTRFDFDGDRKADLAVFNRANGVWSIRSSLTNQTITTQFGQTGDITAPADFDGDGKTDLAVWRPENGVWYLSQSTAGVAARAWGTAGDKPVAADYDGDNKADLAIWRPASGVWWILKSRDNQLFTANFGQAGDVPLVDADFDGDNKADIAVFRPSNNVWYWLPSSDQSRFRAIEWGLSGDIPSHADYNGDGKTDIAVFRPSSGIWYQLLSTPNGNYEFAAKHFGLDGDTPVTADYNGDGAADIAVRRGDIWHLLLSEQGYTASTFGRAAEYPVAAIIVRDVTIF